jgi:hypothetical protein
MRKHHKGPEPADAWSWLAKVFRGRNNLMLESHLSLQFTEAKQKILALIMAMANDPDGLNTRIAA